MSVALRDSAPYLSPEFHLESLPPFKRDIVRALWEVTDHHCWIESATLAGSFLKADDLEGISDIDFIVIVDHLNHKRFVELQNHCCDLLGQVVSRNGWNLKINATLGPLKFNDEKTAVLHLMVYSRKAHVEHVVQSPFTCFDWQLSPAYRGLRMNEVYPTFALQPRHFLSARRSMSDYLRDYKSRVVSFRELDCTDVGYSEIKRQKPMTVRDQHEFAYHIVRFLMKNLVKLLTRTNRELPLEELMATFFQFFPAEEGTIRELFRQLCDAKRRLNFDQPIVNLDRRLEHFVTTFETQFHEIFGASATRHVLFRHGETRLNGPETGTVQFLGRRDPDILPIEPKKLTNLREAITTLEAPRAIASPLKRSQASIHAIMPGHPVHQEPRLTEIDYGLCEGLDVQQARNQHPALFHAWNQGFDPAFPNGESTGDVAQRTMAALNDLWKTQHDTVICTHNVVLRTIVGTLLNIPPSQWYRLRIPHLQPISVVQTRDHGWFIDLDLSVEREIFGNFAGSVS